MKSPFLKLRIYFVIAVTTSAAFAGTGEIGSSTQPLSSKSFKVEKNIGKDYTLSKQVRGGCEEKITLQGSWCRAGLFCPQLGRIFSLTNLPSYHAEVRSLTDNSAFWLDRNYMGGMSWTSRKDEIVFMHPFALAKTQYIFWEEIEIGFSKDGQRAFGRQVIVRSETPFTNEWINKEKYNPKNLRHCEYVADEVNL